MNLSGVHQVRGLEGSRLRGTLILGGGIPVSSPSARSRTAKRKKILKYSLHTIYIERDGIIWAHFIQFVYKCEKLH